MKTSLLIASTLLLTASGFAQAEGDHPSFSEADTNGDGRLNTQELTQAVPELDVQATTATVTAADVKRAMPEVDFEEDDVVNAEPIGEEQYQQIVEAIAEKEDSNSISSI